MWKGMFPTPIKSRFVTNKVGRSLVSSAQFFFLFPVATARPFDGKVNGQYDFEAWWPSSQNIKELNEAGMAWDWQKQTWLLSCPPNWKWAECEEVELPQQETPPQNVLLTC